MTTHFNLSQAADQCVMCGMCLPHCPTYQVSQHEAESPRGRISLVKAFSEGQLRTSKQLQNHLQSCTGCLKCQQVCPAKVDYQAIIDAGRTLYRPHQRLSSRVLHNTAIAATTHRWGHRAIRFSSRLLKHWPTSNRPARLLKYVSHRQQQDQNQSPATVTIFPGCTGALFDQQTLDSLLLLLSSINVQAHLPNAVLCCGAMQQHSGSPDRASQHIDKLKQYLAQQASKVLLSVASGCGRQLGEQLEGSSIKPIDALHWLSTQDAFNSLALKPSKQRVLIHSPCSADADMTTLTSTLLARIPGIELLQFTDAHSCCGAGGLQLVDPHANNQKLLDSKIDNIRQQQPDLIVTSNIGCSLNFQLGLEDTDLDIEVIHPLTLLARQLA